MNRISVVVLFVGTALAEIAGCYLAYHGYARTVRSGSSFQRQ